MGVAGTLFQAPITAPRRKICNRNTQARYSTPRYDQVVQRGLKSVRVDSMQVASSSEQGCLDSRQLIAAIRYKNTKWQQIGNGLIATFIASFCLYVFEESQPLCRPMPATSPG